MNALVNVPGIGPAFIDGGRDGEPKKSGRGCPLRWHEDEDET